LSGKVWQTAWLRFGLINLPVKQKQQPAELASAQTVLDYLVVLLTQSFQAKADARTQVLEHLF